MTFPTISEGDISRRYFLRRLALSAAAVGFHGGSPTTSLCANWVGSPIVVFTKVYQSLGLNFQDAAALTAEAGLDGIDCPVRPGGEILPERVAEDLPRYAEALRAKGLRIPLLTTAITSVSSQNAEQILRTAKNLGVQYYRIGFIERRTGISSAAQVREAVAALKDVAAMNKQIGIGALVQNHSPSPGHDYLGGNLGELYDFVKEFDPAQIGAAFDIGHALMVHGDGWRPLFEKIKPHLKVAYVKDPKPPATWVRFGEGAVAKSGYFKILRESGYAAPISMHIEFDWSDGGKSKDRAALLNALKDSSRTLHKWLDEA